MTPPAVRKDSTRNRARILSAARRVIDDRKAVQHNELAELAGVGVATVYRHFPSAEVLMEALAQNTLEAVALAGESLTESDDPWAALAAFARLIVAAQLSDAAAAPVMSALTDQCPETRVLKRRIDAVWDTLLDACFDAGLIGERLTHADMTPLICAVTYAARVQAESDPVVESSRAERYVTVFLDGLRNAGSPGERSPQEESATA